MAALWGWLINSGGHGDQNVTQTNSNVNNAAFYDNLPGHKLVK
jgi:hypothetical protein